MLKEADNLKAERGTRHEKLRREENYVDGERFGIPQRRLPLEKLKSSGGLVYGFGVIIKDRTRLPARRTTADVFSKKIRVGNAWNDRTS